MGEWKKLLDSNVDPVVVQFFAYLHDSCRQDDFEDLHHGVRVAEWISSIRDLYLQCLTDEQIEKLKTACRLHTMIPLVSSGGANGMGKILTICRNCLDKGIEPEINRTLLNSAEIYILGAKINF